MQVDDALWQVMAVHPYSPRPVRILGAPLPLGVSYRGLAVDLAALLDEQIALGRPTVLLGDFNASEQSLAYRAAHARLDDAFVRAGWGLGFTFPQGMAIRGHGFRGRWCVSTMSYTRLTCGRPRPACSAATCRITARCWRNWPRRAKLPALLQPLRPRRRPCPTPL